MDKKIYDYSLNPDKETLEQFKSCTKKSFVTAGALMPDAHSGYAAPIGSVLVTKGFVVPAWVGFDIGCGVLAAKIISGDTKDIKTTIEKNPEKIYENVLNMVPMGLGKIHKQTHNISKETKSDYNKLLQKYEKKPHDKNLLNFLKNSAIKHIGTLGSGNHFVELGFYENEIWIVVHSGSRGAGHKAAEKYMKKASKNVEDYEKTNPLDVNSDTGKEYLNLLDFCLGFAILNRKEIALTVLRSLEKTIGKQLKLSIWCNNNHNHAVYERGKYIHRKGATPAKKDEKGVIPANMRDGSFLVQGLGNPKFLHSSSHGAGRIMSRSKAKLNISLTDFKKSMEGIKGTITQKTIDEAPMAYKNISDVLKYQKESIKIVKHIKPIINWKG